MVNRTAAICTIIVGFLLCILAFMIFLSNSETQNQIESVTDPISNQNVQPNNKILNAIEEHEINKSLPTIFVTTAKELNEALRNSIKGNKIELAEGMYIGEFNVTQDNLVIRGQGPETIIKLDVDGTNEMPTVALNISGNNFQLSNLKLLSYCKHTDGIQIHSSGAILTDVRFEGFHYPVSSFSDDNNLSHISIKDSAGDGIFILANRSRLNSIKMENITGFGIVFQGDNNTVHSFTCNDCKIGVYVSGNYNLVQNVGTKRPKKPGMLSGIFIGGGEGNVVDSYSGLEDGVTLGVSSSNGKLRNSVSKEVYVLGDGYSVFDVDAGQLLQVVADEIRVENTKAVQLENYGVNMTFVGSTFKSELN